MNEAELYNLDFSNIEHVDRFLRESMPEGNTGIASIDDLEELPDTTYTYDASDETLTVKQSDRKYGPQDTAISPISSSAIPEVEGVITMGPSEFAEKVYNKYHDGAKEIIPRTSWSSQKFSWSEAKIQGTVSTWDPENNVVNISKDDTHKWLNRYSAVSIQDGSKLNPFHSLKDDYYLYYPAVLEGVYKRSEERNRDENLEAVLLRIYEWAAEYWLYDCTGPCHGQRTDWTLDQLVEKISVEDLTLVATHVLNKWLGKKNKIGDKYLEKGPKAKTGRKIEIVS